MHRHKTQLAQTKKGGRKWTTAVVVVVEKRVERVGTRCGGGGGNRRERGPSPYYTINRLFVSRTCAGIGAGGGLPFDLTMVVTRLQTGTHP
jgi:hypothetical protein